MKRRVSKFRWTPAAVALLLSPGFAQSQAGAQPEIRVEPESIHIGVMYSGTPVEISAQIPDSCDAVLEILGKDIEEQLLRKGRHWDIWMSVGEIDIEGAPSVYFAMSSDPSSLDGTTLQPDFGYAALERRASFLGDVKGLRRIKIFDEFVKLKEREKLYQVYPGKLEVSQSPGGTALVRGVFTIPSRIAPDSYQVRLSVLRDGRVVDTRTAPLEVRVVSLPASLFALARHHESIYGILAVLVPAVFGYFIGTLFKKTKPDRHKVVHAEAAVERNKGA